MSEPESHSHRTDQEWRAIIRGWKERLEKHVFHFPESDRVQEVVDLMEKETK